MVYVGFARAGRQRTGNHRQMEEFRRKNIPVSWVLLDMDGPMSIGRMARCARSVRIQAASPKDFRTPCVC